MWRARAMIGRAISLAPHDARALVALGRLNLRDRHYAEAKASYAAALLDDPNNARAESGLGQCAWMLGDGPAAIEHLQRAMRLDPKGSAAKWRYQTLGLALFMQRRFAEARSTLSTALTFEPPVQAPSDALGFQEFTHFFLMAALDRTDDPAGSRQAWRSYNAIWPHRSIWRMLSYLRAGQARMPGAKDLADGLLRAGMPEFADEHEDDHVAAADTPHGGGDFDPTPVSIPGGEAVDASGVKSLLAQSPAPIIVDIGMRAAVLPGPVILRASTEMREAFTGRALAEATANALPAGRTIIVMGTGPFGWDGYDAALRFIHARIGRVVWFRGGEEAWAATGLASRDLREE